MFTKKDHKEIINYVKSKLPPCLECSACCRHGFILQIPKRTALKLTKKKDELKKYLMLDQFDLENFDDHKDDHMYWLKRDGFICMALDQKTNKCKIYDDRPEECRGLPRGHRQCIESFLTSHPKS